MTSEHVFYGITFLGLALTLASVLYIARAIGARRARRNLQGNWVAECWLEWEICTGSTLYRSRFSTPSAAAAAVRRRARMLDWLLPRMYVCEYSSGRKYLEEYGFEIRYGVRPLSPEELKNGVREIWSPQMPGTAGDRGEHRQAHPLSLKGDLAGYKV